MVEEEYRESIVEEIPWFFRRKAFKTMKDDIFLWIGQTEGRVVTNVYTNCV